MNKMDFKRMILLSFGIMASISIHAQASGGQIKRPTRKQSSSTTIGKTATTSRHSAKTYTPREMYEMGRSFYDQGNYQEAIKWYRKAAPQFYELSKKMMKSGNQQCINYFKTVIDMDILPYNVWSLFHLGAIYYYGEGGQATDFSQSFRYFKLAADKGNLPAMYYLGLCFEYGRGIPKDLSKAQQYYNASGYNSAPSRDF